MVAAILVSPLQHSASIVQAETGIIETNISNIQDGIYDIELIVHKDKEEADSIAGAYFKDAILTVKDGKRFITTTIKDSQYFIYLKLKM